jgi:hypothetical protein
MPHSCVVYIDNAKHCMQSSKLLQAGQSLQYAPHTHRNGRPVSTIGRDTLVVLGHTRLAITADIASTSVAERVRRAPSKKVVVVQAVLQCMQGIPTTCTGKQQQTVFGMRRRLPSITAKVLIQAKELVYSLAEPKEVTCSVQERAQTQQSEMAAAGCQ